MSNFFLLQLEIGKSLEFCYDQKSVNYGISYETKKCVVGPPGNKRDVPLHLWYLCHRMRPPSEFGIDGGQTNPANEDLTIDNGVIRDQKDFTRRPVDSTLSLRS